MSSKADCRDNHNNKAITSSGQNWFQIEFMSCHSMSSKADIIIKHSHSQTNWRLLFIYFQTFKTVLVAKKIWRIINTIASIWGENMLGYLSLEIHDYLFLAAHSEQIMSADKYPGIFSRQMEAIVYILLRYVAIVWPGPWALDHERLDHAKRGHN